MSTATLASHAIGLPALCGRVACCKRCWKASTAMSRQLPEQHPRERQGQLSQLEQQQRGQQQEVPPTWQQRSPLMWAILEEMGVSAEEHDALEEELRRGCGGSCTYTLMCASAFCARGFPIGPLVRQDAIGKCRRSQSMPWRGALVPWIGSARTVK